MGKHEDLGAVVWIGNIRRATDTGHPQGLEKPRLFVTIIFHLDL